MTALRRSSLTRFGLTCSLLGLGLAGCNGEGSPPPETEHRAAVGETPKQPPPDDEDKGPINAPEEIVAAARQLLGERLVQDPETILITNATLVELPLVGAKLYSFKAVDDKGEAHTIALSEDGAREMDLLNLEQDEEEKYQALYGSMTPELVQQLEGLPNEAELEIAIWAAVPEDQPSGPDRPDPSGRLTEEAIDKLYEAVDRHRGKQAEELSAPILAKLQDLGREGEADKLAPTVQVTLPVSLIREVARWDNVSKIFATETYEPTLQIARSVVEADVVSSRGITGSGIKVAEIEVGGIFSSANPYLFGTLQDPVFACPSDHATRVAGVIRSTHPDVRGISPNVNLRVAGSCYGNPFLLKNRSGAAATWGARVFNLSFGSSGGTQPGTLDNYYDAMVQDGWRTVVASAGNSGPSARVSSPARAYNVIAVGNTFDFNTIPWLGDAMSNSSSFLNPVSTHKDREKPELVAPGSNIQTTSNSFPWIQDIVSGTSLSAPMVTGTAALLMQRNLWLTIWPEAVKAILMATSVHNIEGSSRLSQFDGAGQIVGALADDVARGVSGNWGGRSYSCAMPLYVDLGTMPLVANRVVRVVIAWDTNPAFNHYSSRPSADLDLYVTDSNNNNIASSASWDNTYEIVEFTAPATASYKIRVRKFSCNMTPKWLGWAWYHNY